MKFIHHFSNLQNILIKKHKTKHKLLVVQNQQTGHFTRHLLVIITSKSHIKYSNKLFNIRIMSGFQEIEN